MIKLKIDDPGHVIQIGNLPPLRTPVEIDIERMDLRKVILYIQSLGIKRYEIISDVERKKDYAEVPEPKVNIKPVEAPSPQEPLILPSVPDHSDRLDRIERLLEKLLTSGIVGIGPGVRSTSQESGEDQGHANNPKADDDEVETFIPTVDVSGMKITSGDKISIKQNKEDIDQAADALSDLIKR